MRRDVFWLAVGCVCKLVALVVPIGALGILIWKAGDWYIDEMAASHLR